MLFVLATTAGIAVALPTRAEQNEPLAQFWLNEQARPPQPRRHIVRPHMSPTPRRAAPVADRRQYPTTPRPSKAVPAQPDFVVGTFGDMYGATIVRGLGLDVGGLTGLAVVDQTGDDAELTRSPLDAWKQVIGAASEKHGHLDAAVIMLGSDEAGIPSDLESDSAAAPWRSTYGGLVEQVAAAFRDKNIPLIWVGLPPVRDEAENRRFLALNAVFREHAAKVGATYVDIWEAFTDENGDYTATGPDVDGQTSKLRRSDGRGFTLAGSRKLASFVAGDLKRLAEGKEASKKLAAVSLDEQSLFDQALQIDVNAQIRREAGLPAQAGPSVPLVDTPDGPVVTLTAPPVSASGKLATLYDEGGRPAGVAAAALDKGIVPSPRAGRTDDFSWPRR